MRWAIFALLLNCSSPAPRPYQAAAIDIVWREQFGMSVAPPTIEWVTGPALNCGKGYGWESYAFLPPICVAGLSTWDPFASKVAWPPEAEFSSTAFAHELCHLREGVTKGGREGIDPNHLGECFIEGGLVDQANEALSEVGL